MPQMTYSKPQLIQGKHGKMVAVNGRTYKEKDTVINELEEANDFLINEAGFELVDTTNLISGYINRTYCMQFNKKIESTGYIAHPGILITTTGSAFETIYDVGSFEDNTKKQPFRHYKRIEEFHDLDDLKRFLLED